MIDDPDLVVRARGHRDGLHADRDRRDVREAATRDVEDFEPIVGRVDGEQTAPIGGHRDRSHGATLPRHERGLRARAERDAQDGDDRGRGERRRD